MKERVQKMVSLMANVSGYTEQEIICHSRSYPLCYLRYCIFWQLAQEGWTRTAIGQEFNMDHSSVSYGIGKIEHILKIKATYDELFDLFSQFKQKLMIQNKMKRIYMSAPIGDVTNDERYKERYDFFKSKEEHYTKLGYVMVNPMDNGLDRFATIYEQMDRDLELLRGCDAILLLENWNRSAGCHTELVNAMACGKEVYIEKAMTLE